MLESLANRCIVIGKRTRPARGASVTLGGAKLLANLDSGLHALRTIRSPCRRRGEVEALVLKSPWPTIASEVTVGHG
jgi:hypothetical protein